MFRPKYFKNISRLSMIRLCFINDNDLEWGLIENQNVVSEQTEGQNIVRIRSYIMVYNFWMSKQYKFTV